MKDDDPLNSIDSLFDYDRDGKLSIDEESERDLFVFGDGSMHEPNGIRPRATSYSSDDDDDDDGDDDDDDDDGDDDDGGGSIDLDALRAAGIKYTISPIKKKWYDENGNLLDAEAMVRRSVVYDKDGTAYTVTLSFS